MNDDVELRHLRYFVAVAEELHFGRAAERLHLSQPPLSQQIRRLEDVIGHALFVRTSRTVKLTGAGEAYLERARRILRNVQRDIEEIRRVGQGEVGSLHIGFVGSAMLTTLPEIFRAYREAYPLVHLHLHESFTSRVAEGLENGTLDAGILRDGDAAETLNVTTLFSEPYVAVLPVTHACAQQKSISPGMLRNELFVYYPRERGRPRLREASDTLRGTRVSTADCAGGVALAYYSAAGGSRAWSIRGAGMRAADRRARYSMHSVARGQSCQ